MNNRIPLYVLLFYPLCLLFSPPRTSAADHWVEVRSAHFIVSSNSSASEARRIANQVEEIRAVFLQTFPALRVDPGKPTKVIAVKNEDSLKFLLPDYWDAKDRVHPTGLFMPALDSNFAVLRTDADGSKENPYHNLYFEYTVSVLRLNFPALPLWLSVGLAEFYGNTTVELGEIGVGHANRAQIDLLKRSQGIPIETLMNVDARSPYYNEKERNPVFYAESWLLVHYLLNDPDARKAQTFYKYLQVYESTNDAQAAAKQTFGDLKHMQMALDSYARQPNFQFQRYKPQAPITETSYPVRDMTSAEVLTIQADFLAHTGHTKQAEEMFKQALEQQPDMAAAYVGSGYVDYLQHNNDAALQNFDKAISLNQQDFRPYHFRALLILRKDGYRKETTPQIIGNLEKAISLNPEFAPAYGFLSVAYRQQDATKMKSFDAAVKAAKLEPSNLAFTVDIGDALLALNHDQDAAKLLEQINKLARTPNEKSEAESFAKRLTSHMDKANAKDGAASTTAQSAVSTPQSTGDGDAAATKDSEKEESRSENSGGRDGGQQGIIREARCDTPTGVTMRFAILGETLDLAAADSSKVAIRVGGTDSTLAANPCAQWNGRKARITYALSADGQKTAQISAIDFF